MRLVWTTTVAENLVTGGAGIQCLVTVSPPAGRKMKLLAWGVYLDGTTGHSVLLQLGTRVGGTEIANSDKSKVDDSISDSIQSLARNGFTGGPTIGTEWRRVRMTAQLSYEETFPRGHEFVMAPSTEYGIFATAGTTIRAVPWMKLEE